MSGPGPRAPLNHAQLVRQLTAAGLEGGRDVLVHCSMRRLGWIAGGADTLLSALQEVIGAEATLVVPAHTGLNSVTSHAFNAATLGLGSSQRDRFADAQPGFDADRSPSYMMGALAEAVRLAPASVRSSHPQASFAALGPAAQRLMTVHDLDSHLGERSPLAELYRADAAILLLGVGYEACTALHLAEYRLVEPPPMRAYRCFVDVDGQRRRRDFLAPHLNDSDFPALGADLDGEPFVRRGQVGQAGTRVMSVRDAVDFAVRWMGSHRQASGAVRAGPGPLG